MPEKIHKISLKFVKKLSPFKKHLIVLAVLLLLVIFKNYFREINVLNVANEKHQDVITVGDGDWVIRQNKSSYSIASVLQSEPGDRYRMIVKVKMKTKNGNLIEGYDEKIDDK